MLKEAIVPLRFAGSCRCAAVTFTVESRAPVPYQLCYCSICRKIAGGGGFAINLGADAATLAVKGREALGIFWAAIADGEGRCRTSEGQRHFCTRCATALWLFDPTWPDLLHPFASAIDTELPTPPSKVHLMLRYKAGWVEPAIGPEDATFEEYPAQSIEAWHRAHGLWIE